MILVNQLVVCSLMHIDEMYYRHFDENKQQTADLSYYSSTAEVFHNSRNVFHQKQKYYTLSNGIQGVGSIF